MKYQEFKLLKWDLNSFLNSHLPFAISPSSGDIVRQSFDFFFDNRITTCDNFKDGSYKDGNLLQSTCRAFFLYKHCLL